MENKNNLNDIEEDKNLYAFQLDDEYDAEKDEDLPTKYELTEELIYGEKEAKQIVKDIYKDMKFVYGRYFPAVFSKSAKFALALVQILFFTFGIAWIILCILYKAYFFIIPVFVLYGLVVYAHFYAEKEEREVWWFKWKKKTITIYKILNTVGKGNILVYINNQCDYMYNAKNGQWQKNKKFVCMDSRLMFKHLNGFLHIDKKENDEIEIYACNPDIMSNETKSKYKSASLTLQHNVPKLLIYWPGYNMAIKKQTLPQHFEFLEINTNRYAEIPKSFIDFCKEQGIEPLEENEHLHYV